MAMNLVGKLLCGATQLAFRGVAMLCISIAITIITGTVFTFFHTIFPLMLDLNSAVGMANFLLASWLSFNLVFNYWMVVRTPAGSCDPSTLSPSELKLAERQKYVVKRRGEGFTLWCHHSDQPKPPRAHYCHVSGELVLKMDHFCPWVGQCVGHYNHRYFVLFLLYLWLSTGYAVLCMTLHSFGLIRNEEVSQGHLYAASSTIGLCFVVCIALFSVITFFLAWSGFLAISNQTTIEFLANRKSQAEARKAGRVFYNPWDMGLRKNLQLVFGDFKHYWEVVLPSTAPLNFDGHHWPSIGNEEGAWDRWPTTVV